MINRIVAPTINSIDKIEFISPVKRLLNHDIPLYHMRDVKNDTVRLELYFDAGSSRAPNGIPAFVNGLLLSGTDHRTSQEIERAINGLGGFYESGLTLENSVVTIHCLRENLLEITKVLMDAIRNVTFIRKEVDEFLADSKQRLQINLEKVAYNARREFKAKMFASEASYSELIDLEDYDQVEHSDLLSFHEKHYKNGLIRVGLVGNIDTEIVEKLIHELNPITCSSKGKYPDDFKNQKGEFYTEKKDAMQSAIRIGRQLFNRTHPDYLDFLVLHTILGDYFGSRLMSNIREDKGYTYGVGCAIPELHRTGYFIIATEVRKDVREATLNEVKKELKVLQKELVGEEELNVVRNYMLGQLLKSADGPYAMMDLFLSAEVQGMSLEMYNKAIERIQSITPERIKELAIKYLNWEDLTVISYG